MYAVPHECDGNIKNKEKFMTYGYQYQHTCIGDTKNLESPDRRFIIGLCVCLFLESNKSNKISWPIPSQMTAHTVSIQNLTVYPESRSGGVRARDQIHDISYNDDDYIKQCFVFFFIIMCHLNKTARGFSCKEKPVLLLLKPKFHIHLYHLSHSFTHYVVIC